MAPKTQALRLIIIADDLTGALDSSAAFARYGFRTHAVTSPEAIARVLAEQRPEVLAVSTHTRDVSPEDAKERVAQVMRALPGGTLIFKKVDSRLKGPIATELDAIPYRKIVAMPAIPSFNRIVINGCVSGFGVDAPISVSDALGHHANSACIPDTRHDEEMDQWIGDHATDTLFLGARSLTERLAMHMAGHASPQDLPLSFPPALCITAGSRDPITLAQINALLSAKRDAVHIPAPNGCLDTAPQQNARITVLQATPGAESLPSETVATNLAASLKKLTFEHDVTWFLTGGATAEAVLLSNDIVEMQILGEILPGLPVCRTENTVFITKSGGFGADDTLIRVAEMICKT
ncbi:four-carbon acid sugar kinase family protein [Halomonas sp. HMF6819]|uniref:four-carbon acid sugar kinase family protein n=1 Tax=Halomonas sp. HMF6819 TaxID=3373085 RepID=UPI0037ACC2E3